MIAWHRCRHYRLDPSIFSVLLGFCLCIVHALRIIGFLFIFLPFYARICTVFWMDVQPLRSHRSSSLNCSYLRSFRSFPLICAHSLSGRSSCTSSYLATLSTTLVICLPLYYDSSGYAHIFPTVDPGISSKNLFPYISAFSRRIRLVEPFPYFLLIYFLPFFLFSN